MGEHYANIQADIYTKQMIVSHSNHIYTSDLSPSLTRRFINQVLLGLRPHLPNQPSHHQSRNPSPVQTRLLDPANAHRLLLSNRLPSSLRRLDDHERLAELYSRGSVLG